MGFFGMLFWIFVVWLVIRTWRRSQNCITVGPGRYSRGHFNHRDLREDYIDSLESRLNELEERLDFTERLLAGKSAER
jgi:hypothetical protein